MNSDLINSFQEKKHLKELNLLFSRNFMVTIMDDDNNVLFYPCMISNLSVDSKKLFVTVYDLVSENIVEETLDNLIGNRWKKKPKVHIVVKRLDHDGAEIYHVEYTDCILKEYHGKNFTYKTNEPYQWYLAFNIGEKVIVKNPNYVFEAKKDAKEVSESIKNKELAILKNSNKMLEEAKEKVRKNEYFEWNKEKVYKRINKAMDENEKTALEQYGTSLESFDPEKIKKTFEKEFAKLKDKLEK